MEWATAKAMQSLFLSSIKPLNKLNGESLHIQSSQNQP